MMFLVIFTVSIVSSRQPISGKSIRCLTGFPCDTNRCIDSTLRCDGNFDCVDHTDELNCELCMINQFRCKNGACIPRVAMCNGITDCRNGEDEDAQQCVTEKCPGKFLCRVNLDECISQPCSNVTLCPDHSDQAPEVCSVINELKTRSISCADDEFRCFEPQSCIHQIYRCDGFQDCEDGSDEKDCILYPIKIKDTQTTEFSCNSGQAIPMDWVCDRKADCPNGDDEQVGPQTLSNCTESKQSKAISCPPSWFTCKSVMSTLQKQECIPNEKRCDGLYDCADHSDELHECDDTCEKSGGFTCRGPASHFGHGKSLCIRREAVCDGVVDCPNGDDEQEGPRTGCTRRRCDVDNGGCSQICQTVGEGVKCSCYSGYITTPGNARSCSAIGDISIFYLENGRLLRRSLRGSFMAAFELEVNSHEHASKISARWKLLEQTNPSDSLSLKIHAFDYALEPKSYPGEGTRIILLHRIKRNPILLSTLPEINEGSEVHRLHQLPLPPVLGIDPRNQNQHLSVAYDWIHDLIYLMDAKLAIFWVVGRHSQRYRSLAQLSNMEHSSDLVVDPKFARVYWISRGVQSCIWTMDMDGENQRQLFCASTNYWANLCIDHVRNDLYWSDQSSGSIESYNWRTNTRRLVVGPSGNRPIGLAVFEDWVYWIDGTKKALFRTNKFSGFPMEQLFTVQNASTFQLQHELLRPTTWVNRCRKSICQHLCIPIPLRSFPNYSQPFRCLCAEDWTVDPTNPNACVPANNRTNSEWPAESNGTLWAELVNLVRVSSTRSHQLRTASVGIPTWQYGIFFIGITIACLMGSAIACTGQYAYRRHTSRRPRSRVKQETWDEETAQARQSMVEPA